MSRSTDIRPLTATEARESLVSDLAPDVDELRQLATDFGIRPYRIFMITTETGSELAGEGEERVIDEEEILPTPKVAPVSQMTKVLSPVGMITQGDVKITEISVDAYTEARLRGKQTDGTDLPANQKMFYEMRLDARYAQAGVTRYRFTPAGLPYLNAGRVYWEIVLKKQAEDRTNFGDLQ